MKVVTFLANGSEDSEAIITIDLLRRANIEVLTVSVDDEFLTLSHNIYMKADKSFKDLSDEYLLSFDGFFLPGGKIGTITFRENERLKNLLIKMNEKKGLLSAICAAPSVFGIIGILNNKNYTCYNGWEEESFNGHYTNKGVEKDSNIITGKSLNYSIEFSLELIEYLIGIDEKNKVSKGILRY